MRPVVAAAALAVLTACTPASPTPSPVTSSPSVSASPSATPSPTCSLGSATPKPCTTKEFEQEQFTAEAMDVYRRWIKEANRLYLAGGTLTPTDEMKATLSGIALDSAEIIFADMKKTGVRAIQGEVKIVSITPTTPEADGTATFDACSDGRTLVFQRKRKTISRGTFADERFVAKHVDGSIKLVDVMSEATECGA